MNTKQVNLFTWLVWYQNKYHTAVDTFIQLSVINHNGIVSVMLCWCYCIICSLMTSRCPQKSLIERIVQGRASRTFRTSYLLTHWPWYDNWWIANPAKTHILDLVSIPTWIRLWLSSSVSRVYKSPSSLWLSRTPCRNTHTYIHTCTHKHTRTHTYICTCICIQYAQVFS